MRAKMLVWKRVFLSRSLTPLLWLELLRSATFESDAAWNKEGVQLNKPFLNIKGSCFRITLHLLCRTVWLHCPAAPVLQDARARGDAASWELWRRALRWSASSWPARSVTSTPTAGRWSSRRTDLIMTSRHETWPRFNCRWCTVKAARLTNERDDFWSGRDRLGDKQLVNRHREQHCHS